MNITIGVDCGGTRIKVALLKDGRILDYSVFPNSGDQQDLDKIVKNGFKLCKNVGCTQKDILGMGFSLAGIVDYRKGILVSTNDKNKWSIGFNFKEWAKEKFFSLPVVVENDARLALLGEVSYGVAKGYKNAVLFMPGTGIGTSAIIEGVLLRGIHNQAGILGGHMGSDINGFPCNCGGLGCLEAQIGTWQLPHRLHSIDGFHKSILKDATKLDYKTLFDAYSKQDSFAIHAVEDILKLWGVGIINLVHAYDPEVVVFSGGVMNSADIIMKPVSEYVKKYAWAPWGEVKFVVAEDVNSSALLGAEALLKESENIAV